jgi:hypothetical protein
MYTEAALPAVRPVSFAAPDGAVIIPAGQDRWGAQLVGTVVGFEAGEIDPGTRTGWSVLAVGHARIGTDPASDAGRPLVAIDI